METKIFLNWNSLGEHAALAFNVNGKPLFGVVTVQKSGSSVIRIMEVILGFNAINIDALLR